MLIGFHEGKGINVLVQNTIWKQETKSLNLTYLRLALAKMFSVLTSGKWCGSSYAFPREPSGAAGNIISKMLPSPKNSIYLIC